MGLPGDLGYPGTEMKPIVSLSAVADELDLLIDEMQVYLNRRTGELVPLPDEVLGAAEAGDDLDDYPDWQQEMIVRAREVLASDDYLTLPDKFEIHEYSIMERFCLSRSDPELREDLLSRIRVRGAFQRFKEAAHRLEIMNEWNQYREQALRQIARDWLEDHGIPFFDD